jgi:hypothetical protein
MLRFTRTREDVTEAEAAALDGTLHAAGLDRGYWRALRGMTAVHHRDVRPWVLRAYRGERFVGLLHFFEARRAAHTLFPGWMGRVADTLPMPIYYWNRMEPAVDLHGSPGFFVEGEDADGACEAAARYLDSLYVMGCVYDDADRAPLAGSLRVPFAWSSVFCPPQGDSLDSLFRARKHLRRKVAKFRNKGGAIETVRGRVPPSVRDAMLRCLEGSVANARVFTTFQDAYPQLVRWAAEAEDPSLLHVVARLDGEVVGYHSFLHSGRVLACLSGAFDRGRHTTYHAYENVLLEAMRLAEGQGVDRLLLGPVLNPTKASLTTRARRATLCFRSRFAPVRVMQRAVVPRSALGGREVAASIAAVRAALEAPEEGEPTR